MAAFKTEVPCKKKKKKVVKHCLKSTKRGAKVKANEIKMASEINFSYANLVICLLGKSFSNGRVFSSHTNNGELLRRNSQGL